MTDRYIPQVGDRVRRISWPESRWADVLYVGDTWVVGRTQSGYEQVYWALHPVDGGWVKVEPLTPLPEFWANLADGSSSVYVWHYPSRPGADACVGALEARGQRRIAVLHVWTDDDGDHAEIERV